jgi:hypothetical protein
LKSSAGEEGQADWLGSIGWDGHCWWMLADVVDGF